MTRHFIFNQFCIILEKYNVNYTVEDSVIIAIKKNIEIYVDCFCGITIKYKNKLHYFCPCDLTVCFIYIISKIEEKRE